MSVPSIIEELKDVDGNPIISMNADWTSQPYPMGSNVHIASQFRWSDMTLTGVFYLDYTCAPIDRISNIEEEDWINFQAANLVGDKNGVLFLDSNLAISAFRYRFENISGTADLEKVYIVRKRNY